MLITLCCVAFFAPFWASATPILVDGTTAGFTIVVLSYGPRLPMLRGAIKHYSHCPSAQGVVVVWNKGPPPDAGLLPSTVPVHIRVEPTNSLNNRFRPDPAIATRAVFSIDDDIRIPCADVEAAFAEWRAAPEVLVGFFPRLLEGEPEPTFRGEAYAVQRGRYNAVLTGAAFLDAHTALPAYWADQYAAARAAVDEVFNGEDLLMNYVLASRAPPESPPPVKFYQPKVRVGVFERASLYLFRVSFFFALGFAAGLTHPAAPPLPPSLPLQRRLDISKFSSVGISHDMSSFESATVRYLRAFTQTFRGNPLRTQTFAWTRGVGRGPLFCGVPPIGCLYL